MRSLKILRLCALLSLGVAFAGCPKPLPAPAPRPEPDVDGLDDKLTLIEVSEPPLAWVLSEDAILFIAPLDLNCAALRDSFLKGPPRECVQPECRRVEVQPGEPFADPSFVRSAITDLQVGRVRIGEVEGTVVLGFEGQRFNGFQHGVSLPPTTFVDLDSSRFLSFSAAAISSPFHDCIGRNNPKDWVPCKKLHPTGCGVAGTPAPRWDTFGSAVGHNTVQPTTEEPSPPTCSCVAEGCRTDPRGPDCPACCAVEQPVTRP